MTYRKAPLPRNPRDARAGGDGRESRPPMSGRPPAAPAPVPAAVAKAGVPHGATEVGWLPDCVYTGEKFETGLAFFADTVGRITRFSREPADLAVARRLAGQAALPGLVNTHSHAFHRLLRGRTEARGRAEPNGLWREFHDRAAARLTDEEVFDTARMAFMEMLLAGVTCVGEFHYLQRRPEGGAYPDATILARAVIRAAHEVGIRIALLNVAWLRGDFGGDATAVPPRFRTDSADQFVRETEALRQVVEKEFPADEAWVGIAPYSLGAVPLDQLKPMANYAHTQRMRLHLHVGRHAAESAACVAEYGRAPVALLAEHGLVDKRFTAVDALHLSDDEVKLLGAARATACVGPVTARNLGWGTPPIEKLLAAGAGIALGTDSHGQIDLLKEARLLEYDLRQAGGPRGAWAAEPATTLFRAATFTGARSLGATGGALEVGRPADFFTVALFDPSIAGADPEVLLANVVFALERRAVRDVWVGARQQVANGRHALHGPVVGRFVEAQRRIWAA